MYEELVTFLYHIEHCEIIHMSVHGIMKCDNSNVEISRNLPTIADELFIQICINSSNRVCHYNDRDYRSGGDLPDASAGCLVYNYVIVWQELLDQTTAEPEQELRPSEHHTTVSTM